MLKTSLWRRRLQRTWVADGTHQTRTQSPSTFKHFFSTVSRYLIPQRQRIRCKVAVARIWRLVSRRRLLQIACQPSACDRVKEMELPGAHTANWTCSWLRSNEWGGEDESIDHPTYLPDLAPSNFHLLGPLKKYLPGKGSATEADIKQVVTCHPLATDTWQWVLLRWDTRLGVTVRHRLNVIGD